jgi:flagellar biogenesis protein FliO
MFEAFVKAVIFVILLALGGYFFVLFRRKGWFFPQRIDGAAGANDLRVTERLSVGGRHYIAVVRCNGQEFLIGISPTSITAIGVLRSARRGGEIHRAKGEHFPHLARDFSARNRDISREEVPCPR